MRMPCATLALLIVAAGGGRTAVAAGGGRTAVAADEPGGPLLRIVKEGLEAREASFQGLKFHVEFQGQTRSMPGLTALERVEVIDAVVDANQRVKIDELSINRLLLHARPGGDRRWPIIHTIASASAKESRSITWSAGDERPLATVRGRYDPPYWQRDPLDLLKLGRYNLTREFDDPNHATFEGVDSVLGQRTIRISTRWEFKGQPGSETHFSYWFGADIGYALVRYVREWRPDHATPPRQIESMECEGFQREGPLWLPSKVVFRKSVAADGRYDVGTEFDATFSNWVVNPPLDDKDFEVEVPPGSVVGDRDKNLGYIKGSIHDPAIKGDLDQFRKSGAGKVAIPPPNLPGPDAVEHFQKLARENPYTKPAPDDVPATVPPPR